jgi:hypothetical protein
MKTKNRKKIICICSFLVNLGIMNTVMANDIFCPDDIVCTTPSDMSSCYCRINKVKTNDWVVTTDGDEGAYISRGAYNFHNAAVMLQGSKATETACVYTYFTADNSEARLACKANASNLMPVLNDSSVWQLIYNTSLEYLCGNYNQKVDKSLCPLK